MAIHPPIRDTNVLTLHAEFSYLKMLYSMNIGSLMLSCSHLVNLLPVKTPVPTLLLFLPLLFHQMVVIILQLSHLLLSLLLLLPQMGHLLITLTQVFHHNNIVLMTVMFLLCLTNTVHHLKVNQSYHLALYSTLHLYPFFHLHLLHLHRLIMIIKPHQLSL